MIEVEQVLTYLDAAEAVLRKHSPGAPMHYRKITELAISQGLLTPKGITPEATLVAQISQEIKRRDSSGKAQRFRAAGRGMYGLASIEHHALARAAQEHNLEVRDGLRNELATMDPKAFEVLIGRLLTEIGFEAVEVTKYSGDGGIDVRATLRVGGVTDVRTAVQVKRWAKTNNVTGRTVRELRGGLGPHERGLIITLSDFTKDAKAEAAAGDRSPVSLVDGERLIELLIDTEIGVRATPLTMLELDAAALAVGPEVNAETPKVMAIWPMPGGKGQWRASLDTMLDHVRSVGPSFKDLRSWILEAFPTVNSANTATSYVQTVLRALDLIEFNGDSVALTATGSTYLEAPSAAALLAVLQDRIAGVVEIESLCREQPRSLEDLASLVPPLIGASWETTTQIKWRIQWLEELGALAVTTGKWRPSAGQANLTDE